MCLKLNFTQGKTFKYEETPNHKIVYSKNKPSPEFSVSDP